MRSVHIFNFILFALTITSTFSQIKPEDSLFVKAKPVDELSSEYFGYFDIEFVNKSDQWLTLKNVEIIFPESAQNRHIRAISGTEFVRWQSVMQKKITKEEFNKNASLAVIGALGYGLAMASGNSTLQNIGTAAAVGAAGTYTLSEYSNRKDSINQTKRFPENHLLTDSIVVLPGLSETRWLLLNSMLHDSTKLVSSFTINFTVNDGSRLSRQIKVGRMPWQARLRKPASEPSNTGMGTYR